ncbi:hypothetical protein EMPS_00045 [Entomortierella parvispora]|uniref:F-box domain-containing protein n=1 Tax=Entomortierella parvispora TaxID=205924 RepID=A0A9P3GYZ2_9FUNG|nr:hypothetical protein EMPS_00045 [Entomortierella parvispora]
MSNLVFSIPELTDAIADYLDRSDLVCLLRVSRLLYPAFAPRLWRHVTVRGYTLYLAALFPKLASATASPSFGIFKSTPPLAGLIRNSHWIQSVTIQWDDNLQFHSSPISQLIPQREGGPSVFFSWPEDPSEVLIHKAIKRLYPCPGQALSKEMAQQQMKLQLHLYKMLPGHLQAAVFAALLEKIGEARAMYQTWQKNRPRGPIRPWTSLSIISKGTIRPVHAASGPCGTGHFQHSLYRCSQIFRDMAISFVLQAALRATTNADTAIDPTVENPFFTSDSTTQEERCSLENLTVARCDGFGALSVFVLIQSPALAKSLKRLDIRGCANFRSEEMHVLLESLPHLERVDFRARHEALMRYAGIAPRRRMNQGGPVKTEVDYFCAPQHQFLDRLMMEPQKQRSDTRPSEEYAIQRENEGSTSNVRSTQGTWSCASSLKVFRIGINNSESTVGSEPLNPNLPVVNPSRVACPGEYRWFYELVAPLTNLRELCLVTGFLNWTEQSPLQIDVKHGLDLWQGLKTIELFDFEGLILPWRDMWDGRHCEKEDKDQTRKVDVQWIGQHWPRLRIIKGLWYRHQMIEANPEDLPKSVQWLKENRPEVKAPLSLWPREWGSPETEEEDLFIHGYHG